MGPGLKSGTFRSMDRTVALLAEWMPRQRWFAAKSHTPRLRQVAAWDAPSPDPAAQIRTLVVADDAADPVVRYQVPIVVRSAPVDDTHVIGRLTDEHAVIDGPHDPAYAEALRRQVMTARGPWAATVLAGEQSNTSIVYRSPGATPVICKVFRRLDGGINPDIELQTALADAGSPHVPALIGSVDGEWPGADGPQRGSLVFAQEFLTDAEDAWRVARRAAAAGAPFTAPATTLGAATAEVHAVLARLFPARPADPAARAATLGAWRRRLAIAVAEAPDLASFAEEIGAVYDRASGVTWPSLQRIHGDYHLGQVLQRPTGAWVLLDFEGEPLRPMAERRQPDLPLRDVAGMLRSFDYVAGSLPSGGAPVPGTRTWARTAARAFLAGYEDAGGAPTRGPLLDALELDKAVYEAIYEARNRPSWLRIPLEAISRLVTGTRP